MAAELAPASPKVKVAKPIKPRAPMKVEITNRDAETQVVSTSEIKSLNKLKYGVGGQPVEFNALFNRQNNFGGFEFFPEDDELRNVRDLITEQLEFKEAKDKTNCCIKHSDYHGRTIIVGKLNKQFKERVEKGESAVPEDESPVKVTGRLQVRKVKGKPTCFLTIDKMVTLVSENPEEEDEEDEA
jgi:hypothetical protein